MNSSNNEASPSRSPSNAETEMADSNQVLPSTPDSEAPNNGVIALRSQPLQMMTLADNMANATQSLATENETRNEELDDLDMDTGILLIMRKAYNYQVMAQKSLEAGCNQRDAILQERSEHLANESMETASLKDKVSKFENEKESDDLFAGKQNERLNKQRELDDCNAKIDEMRAQAVQQASLLEKERADGMAKQKIIEEQEKTITELRIKLENSDRDLQETKDHRDKIIVEYLDYLTKPSTLNKLVYEKVATNPSPGQMQTLLANYYLERTQPSKESDPVVPGTSIGTKSKKRKN